MSTIKKIREAIESKPTRSAWDNGVKVYAAELLARYGRDRLPGIVEKSPA